MRGKSLTNRKSWRAENSDSGDSLNYKHKLLVAASDITRGEHEPSRNRSQINFNAGCCRATMERLHRNKWRLRCNTDLKHCNAARKQGNGARDVATESSCANFLMNESFKIS